MSTSPTTKPVTTRNPLAPDPLQPFHPQADGSAIVWMPEKLRYEDACNGVIDEDGTYAMRGQMLRAAGEEIARLQIEQKRLLTALELCAIPDTKDTKPGHKIAQQALAGYKTLMQRRWEWQGESIQLFKQKADELETTLHELLFHLGDAGENCKAVQDAKTALRNIATRFNDGLKRICDAF